MRKIGCLPAGLLIFFLLIGGCCLYVASWPDEWLIAEVEMQLPVADATVRVQTWTGLSGEHPYILVVDTPQGSHREKLWQDWGPQTEVNFYKTKENWLAVFGAGFYYYFIDVENKDGPRALSYTEFPKDDGEDWVYLGLIYPGPDGGFVPPSRRRECLNLFSAGSYPYRKTHQVEHSHQCPH